MSNGRGNIEFIDEMAKETLMANTFFTMCGE